MKVSVIIPFKNEELHLVNCIESLLKQKFNKQQYEIIFVDNNSQDQSRSIVKRYKQIKLLSESRGNEYTARNKALLHARGDILAFTDADCTVDQYWLRNITKQIENGADFVIGRRLFPRKASYFLKICEKYDNFKAQFITDNKLSFYYFGYTNNMAISRKVFKKMKKFREKPVNGDTQIIHEYRNLKGSCDIRYEPNAVITHNEITSLHIWFKKLYSYGKQNSLYSRSKNLYKQLELSEQQMFFKDKRLDLLEKIIAIPLLATGFIIYRYGTISSKWHKKNQS